MWQHKPPHFACILWGVLLAEANLVSLWAGDAGQLRPWGEYKTIMWLGESAYKQPGKARLMFQRLREMGINTAMVYNDGNLEPLLTNQFAYYVENIVNRGLCLKFNSKVNDWEKFVTDWVKAGRPESALVRDFCLDDPQWQSWALRQMQTVVRKNRMHAPLAYDIRDELSTTISANPFDFDFGAPALARFRDWLKTQYPDLTALNEEWETRFNSWDEIEPFTTDQIKNRMASGQALPRGSPDWSALQNLRFFPSIAEKDSTRWNFSPWADFRTYMDLSLTRALESLRQAAREMDPETPVGIEGTQMPHAFGGYDLWRLAQVLDWIEPYDIGNAREILGSFMADKPILTTVFESAAQPARRRLWHLLLEGDRGCIVWWSEDCIDWQSPDYRLTAKAVALAPVLREMTSPLGRLFLRATPERDPIFIHYSQSSIQVDWLLESNSDGATWVRRFSSFEADHNRQAKVRNAWTKALQDLGYSPRFMSTEQIEAGALAVPSNAVIVLPSSWAISQNESSALRKFLHASDKGQKAHILLADGTPGLFDQHGRFRQKPALDEFAPKDNTAPGCFALRNGSVPNSLRYDCANYLTDRLKQSSEADWANWIRIQLNPIEPEISLPRASCTRIHRFRIGNSRVVAFERNINYHMSEELKQLGANDPLEKPIELEARLRQAKHVYDLQSRKYLGFVDRIRFRLDPWQPRIFALLSREVPAQELLSGLLQE